MYMPFILPGSGGRLPIDITIVNMKNCPAADLINCIGAEQTGSVSPPK